MRSLLTRRELAGLLAAPAFLRAGRPEIPSPAMAGDVIPGAATVWSRAGLPSRMIVEWRTSERGEARRIRGPHCVSASDFTGRVELTSLPPGQTILYKVQFEDLANGRTISETTGHFRTPPGLRDIRFLWSGDMCGQGFGIPKGGSIPIFEEMRRLEPDFFIHSGDTIYADGPIPAEVTAPDGVWRNEVSDDKAKVAETLDEFRGAYRYNLLDKNFREFISSTAQVWQWDDHEVMNNWSPSKSVLNDARYKEKNIPLLVARAARAFHDYAPLRSPRRVYRKIEYGPLLDVFVLDMRSYRGPNTANLQKAESAETRYFGAGQFAWLQNALRSSRAVWKAIACDMPLSVPVDDENNTRWEAFANNDPGKPLGRELEVARLLRFIKQSGIRNVVWFTADVHYTSAIFYDPHHAVFTEFDPFWEFISGPLNAGTFKRWAPLDQTFGAQEKYANQADQIDRTSRTGLAPSAGKQFFGDVRIEAASKVMTVSLRDLTGAELHRETLGPN